MNFEINVKDILLETFILTSKINDKEIINNLIELVRNNKNEKLSFKTHVKGHFTGFDRFNNNENFHKFLKLIKPQIQIICKNNFIIKEAWGNILKKDGEVSEHSHGDFVFCGILYLSEGGPGTYFKQYNITIKEEIGKFVLFHPFLLHSVKKIEEDIERITIAFNMSAIKEWDSINNTTWIDKDEV